MGVWVQLIFSYVCKETNIYVVSGLYKLYIWRKIAWLGVSTNMFVYEKGMRMLPPHLVCPLIIKFSLMKWPQQDIVKSENIEITVINTPSIPF